MMTNNTSLNDSVLSGQFIFPFINFDDESTPVLKLDHNYPTPIQQINSNLDAYKNLINIAHMNAVSIPKHRSEIHRILNETNLDILAVSETNIKVNTPQDVYKMENYNFYQKTRDYKARGGVGIYVKDTLKTKQIGIKYELAQPEICFVEVTVNNIKMAIGVVYKSPSERYGILEEIQEIIAFITSMYAHVIIMGDFNINQLNRSSPACKFLQTNILEPFELTQIIKEPTRITKHTSTLLDLIIVNDPSNAKFSGVVDLPGISDHCLVYMAYALRKPKYKPKMITRRDFRKFSEENFKRDMELAPWGNIYAIEEEEIDDQVTILENIFSDIIDAHAPYRTFRVTKPAAPWLTEEVKNLMDLRDRYKNKYNKDRNESTFNMYKDLRNQVTHAVRKAKITTFNEKINCKIKNSKEFHKELKKHNVVMSKQTNNHKCNLDPNILNEAFVKNNNEAVNEITVCEEIGKIIMNTSCPKFEFREVSEKEVRNAVKSIRTNACGIDNISAYFIKLSINYSIHAITEIMNASLKYNYFPNRWKKARILPLPKNTHPSNPTDYRPISLLLAFSKILEKLVAQQMTNYLRKEKMLDEHQSAYKKYHSTTTALLDITDNIYQAMDKSDVTLLVLLDYSKAFDCANHELIMAKLKAMGFKESALEWIKSYLNKRQQQVITENGKSEWVTMKNGVPQGSILGPLLFTVLVSDLNKVINHCKYQMYADDTQIYYHDKPEHIADIVQKINSDLSEIAEFSKKNCLKLNTSKSNYIVIGSTAAISKVEIDKNHNINMNGDDIIRKLQVKNLGVSFDQTLSWEYHINNLIANAYGKIKQIYRHRNFMNVNTRIKVCEAYILSHFNYCDLIFQNMSGVLRNKIQKVQNTCTRFIFGLRKFDHITSNFKTLNTLNMQNRRLLHSITQMHKIERKEAPGYLLNRIRHFEDIHSHNTRGKKQILIPKLKTAKRQNAFFAQISKKYNDIILNSNMNKNTSIQTFKKRCKEYIFKYYKNDV